MKKFSIKDLNIIHKDEKINALKLENKNEKFILYGNTDKNIQENDFFTELKFKEEISITPKKKIQSLNLQIEKENNFNIIKIKDFKVFYLKDNNSVSFEKDDFKLILSNGTLYNSNKIIKLDHEDKNNKTKSENDNLVKNILLKNNNNSKLCESSDVVQQETKKVQEASNVVVEETNEVQEASNVVVEETNEVQEASNVVVEETKKVQEASNVVQEGSNVVVEETKKVQEASNVVVEETSDNNSETSTEKNENYVNYDTFQKSIIDSNKNEENNVQINKNINKEIKAKNDSELYNLDQILNDFNKYFIDENTKNENKYETQEISFYNKKYNINVLEVESSILNIKNLFKTTILPKNIINDNNVSIKLKNNNSSYIILYLKNPYLFNKVDSKLIITNLDNKKSIMIQNNQYFKLNNINFYIVNNCTLMIPIMNKLISNKFGQKINLFEPLI